MDGNDGSGARGDGGLDVGGVDVEVAGIDVDQHRPGVEVADDLGGGGEGIGGGDDLITPLQANGFQGQVHGRSAGVDGNGVSGADRGGKLRLELSGFGAGGDPPRIEGFGNVMEFGFVDIRQGKGEKMGAHGWAVL